MNEPTPEKGNLDELTRLTLRVISLETELGKLTQRFLDENTGLIKEIRALEHRTATLEDARIQQRKLNETYSEALHKPVEKPKPFWSWKK